MKNLTRSSLLVLAICLSPAAWADRESASQALTEAKALIRAAERNGAQMHAPVVLKAARDNINRAQVEFDDRDYDDAEIAAEKAQRDAELADTKTIALKAEMARDEMNQAVETLRRELNRNGGDS